MQIKLLPFKVISKKFGLINKETQLDNIFMQESLSIAKKINQVVAVLPMSCKCLEQAIVAQILLARRKIPSTLYLGVAKSSKLGLCAHAWLRCGTKVVTGERGMQQFTVVSTFARFFP